VGITVIVDWVQGNNVPGYTTTLLVSLLTGGITLVSLGIIGEICGQDLYGDEAQTEVYY